MYNNNHLSLRRECKKFPLSLKISPQVNVTSHHFFTSFTILTSFNILTSITKKKYDFRTRLGCGVGVGVFSHMKYNDNAATLRLPCFKGVPPWPQSRGFVFQSSQRLTPTSLVMPVDKIYKMMQN